MRIKTFYDSRTSTLTYIVYDDKSLDAVVIDPVLDYDPASSKVWTESVREVLGFLRANDLKLHYILETHAHADHLSGSQMIKEHYPEASVAIGRNITVVQQTFKKIFDLPEQFAVDGRQFDRLFDDNETVSAGTLTFRVLYTPGHTPACVSYLIDDAVFTGDALFMPDMGTGRCDFPMGSAEDLYNSITKRLYTLPDVTRVFVGHDYQPDGREVAYESTVAEEKSGNIQLREETTLDEFREFRTGRDKQLAAPRLLFQSIQVNIDAGSMPDPNDNCQRYLKIPLNVFRADQNGELVLDECPDATTTHN